MESFRTHNWRVTHGGRRRRDAAVTQNELKNWKWKHEIDGCDVHGTGIVNLRDSLCRFRVSSRACFILFSRCVFESTFRHEWLVTRYARRFWSLGASCVLFKWNRMSFRWPLFVLFHPIATIMCSVVKRHTAVALQSRRLGLNFLHRPSTARETRRCTLYSSSRRNSQERITVQGHFECSSSSRLDGDNNKDVLALRKKSRKKCERSEKS